VLYWAAGGLLEVCRASPRSLVLLQVAEMEEEKEEEGRDCQDATGVSGGDPSGKFHALSIRFCKT